MRLGWQGFAAVLAALAATNGAGAQEAATPVTRVFLMQAGDADAPPADGRWRGGISLGSWSAFVPAERLPAEARKPGVEVEAALVVAIDDRGAITGCDEWNQPAPGALAAAACAALRANARFDPRRTAPGASVASRRVYLLRAATRTVAEWETLDSRVSPAPSPPPGASPVLSANRQWPPRIVEYGALSPEGALPPLDATGALYRGKRAATGLLLDILPDGTRRCEVMETAGDAARDAASCTAAEAIAWRYDRPCDLCFPQRVALLAAWDGRNSRLQLPVRSYGSFPRLVGEPLRPGDLGPARPAGLKSYASLTIAVGRDGRPGACRVSSSSGDAALDQRLCALLTQRGRFTPGTDLFGRAQPADLSYVARFDALFPAP